MADHKSESTKVLFDLRPTAKERSRPCTDNSRLDVERGTFLLWAGCVPMFVFSATHSSVNRPDVEFKKLAQLQFVGENHERFAKTNGWELEPALSCMNAFLAVEKEHCTVAEVNIDFKVSRAKLRHPAGPLGIRPNHYFFYRDELYVRLASGTSVNLHDGFAHRELHVHNFAMPLNEILLIDELSAIIS